ncbi:MAG: exodeoxyribonuclease VII small subunit [Saprospiraceae bacterium]|nr:exodeoxyribonuclease VII small subunit [Saprospiraceae bacterium]
MTHNPPAGYAEAMAELQQIVEAVQSDQVDIDQLADYTRRANELIAWCRERLRQVEEALEKEV